MESIYKFNNGNGAMLCNKCRTIISTGPKTEQLYCAKCNPENTEVKDQHLHKVLHLHEFESEPKYKLVRERDGLIMLSKNVRWLEFDENWKYKADFNEPAVDRSLIMSPFNQFFTWQTTPVIEILEQREDYLRFKTKNSNYELFKIKDND